jgi:hypothetical protein
MKRSSSRLAGLSTRIRSLVSAIEQNDEREIEQAILRLSRSRRVFAPLGFAIGAIVLLFDAVKLIVLNVRLLLIQVLPAMWIWLAMLDLKVHVLHGRQFHPIRGPILIPLNLVIIAITIGCFFLNAVFAFAISHPGRPDIPAARRQALEHIGSIAISGAVVGAMLGFSTTIVTRWGHPWFSISLGIVVGIMMISYIALPSRMIGAKRSQSRRDRISTAVVSGALSATVSMPPYVLGRIGILMLGSKVLLIPGIILLAIGLTLQAGATGAVRAIKMSATLTAAVSPGAEDTRDAAAPG